MPRRQMQSIAICNIAHESPTRQQRESIYVILRVILLKSILPAGPAAFSRFQGARSRQLDKAKAEAASLWSLRLHRTQAENSAQLQWRGPCIGLLKVSRCFWKALDSRLRPYASLKAPSLHPPPPPQPPKGGPKEAPNCRPSWRPNLAASGKTEMNYLFESGRHGLFQMVQTLSKSSGEQRAVSQPRRLGSPPQLP